MKRLVCLARASVGHDIKTDLSEEQYEPSRQGTQVPEPKVPEYCPPPMVNVVHQEPVTVTENIPELVETRCSRARRLFSHQRRRTKTKKGTFFFVAKR